ncbi:VirD4-like conjugal transfer protein, CD1115 family [Coprococcus sp. RTP21281st1_F1_RTP21281_210402]|uniref:VirD4-like conjugal transfer protein, CD1115 family n=1 Tax=Coprococcus sp. RTP21281st1_F1_RTP21281_210402 TaxID=3143208 RepID=UPI0034A5ACC3
MGNKNIGGAILDDLKALPKKILKPYYKNGKLNANKIAIDGIPFVIIFYVINKYVQAVVSADGGDMLDKCVKAFSLIFQVKPYFTPSFKLTPLICGIGAGVAFKLFMNSRKKNAKQFRPREEYGSAKWGTDKDFEPYTDPVKWNNIPLTATEWLRMTRPEHPKYDRNKNILIVGGSGAGKTRGFVKPSLMQMQCSYVVTDPKGTVLEEVGTMLARGAWELDDKGNKVPKVGKNGQVLKTKSGKVIYKRTPYKIKVFNTINFAKSMHYNPFAYIHTEQDVLKFVNTLIANTKGEGAQSGEDFWVKAERLLFTAYVAYIVKYCKKSERNFVSLLAMIDASETREEDEDFENAIDLMFKDIEFGNEEEGIEADPDSFAVRQYHKYKLAAGKTAKSILVSCGARLAPFDIKEVREITAYDELDLGDIGRRKTALFVIISDTDDSLNFLVSIMYTQLFNLLCTIADDEYHGKLPVHVRCILDEFANIGQIPKFDKLIATIRSREISASIILQSKAQLKSIYKDNAETIEGNCDTFLFLGGKEKSTLKDLSEVLGKETIDTYNTSDTRGTSQSYGLNYQKLGRELMSQDRLALMDGGKCILQVRGVRPFFSDKVDITAHEMYKELSDFDKKNQFDIEKYVSEYGKPKFSKII